MNLTPPAPPADSPSGEPRVPLGVEVPGWSGAERPSTPALGGRTCRLEALDPARHGPALWRAFSAPGAAKGWTYLAYGPFSSEQDFQRWLEPWATSGARDPFFYAIVPHGEQALGLAAYLAIAATQGSVEIGHVHFSPALQRTTAATEAMALMMRYAFEELRMRRVEWKCNALNAASRAAALRLGFTYEGTFRQHRVDKGRNRDSAWFSVIDSEWPALDLAFRQWLAPENFSSTSHPLRSLRDIRAQVRPIP